MQGGSRRCTKGNAMNVFALTDDRWIDYCKSFSPNIPHTGPMPLIVPLAICCFFTAFLLVLVSRHVQARKRPVMPDHFEKAYERVTTCIPLLKTCSGEDLYGLCRAISRDLLEITSFVNNDVARFISKYHSGNNFDIRRIVPMTLLVRENQLLRYGALQIQILYYIKPLRASMVRRTNLTMRIFLTSWTVLMERYCSENVAFLNQLWKAQR
jgi:hypothetical protein